MSQRGWIGVDLDGTLAYYDKWISETHIGAPIPLMVKRVKAWLDAGADVRIFTARVSQPDTPNKDGTKRDIDAVVRAIESWCLEHIGKALPVTCSKDFGMITLWDDRCITVMANTGMCILDISVRELELLLRMAGCGADVAQSDAELKDARLYRKLVKRLEEFKS